MPSSLSLAPFSNGENSILIFARHTAAVRPFVCSVCQNLTVMLLLAEYITASNAFMSIQIQSLVDWFLVWFSLFSVCLLKAGLKMRKDAIGL